MKCNVQEIFYEIYAKFTFQWKHFYVYKLLIRNLTLFLYSSTWDKNLITPCNMYAKTVYYRKTIRSFKWTYFTLSNAGIAEVDTGHSQHWYTDFSHNNLNKCQVNHLQIKNYQQATLHILLFLTWHNIHKCENKTTVYAVGIYLFKVNKNKP